MWSVRNSCDAKLTTEAELSAVFQQMEMKTDHHVRFEKEALVSPKDNNIIIQKNSDECLSIHLGFLQVGHRYHVSFHLSPDMCANGFADAASSDGSSSTSSVFNPNCHLLSLNPCEDGKWHLVVEYFAHKEKLMKEELVLITKNDGVNLKLTFHARVLGRGKGTPLLRNGINSVGVELEDDSEASDWQGFE